MSVTATGTIVTCSAHLINNGLTLRGDTITIEWQGTGPGANVNPPLSFLCKISGINYFEECEGTTTQRACWLTALGLQSQLTIASDYISRCII